MINQGTGVDSTVEVQRRRHTEQITNINEEYFNQFMNDNEARNRLMEIKDSLNIRELSQKYSNGNNKRSKKTDKFSFTPKKIILMRKRGINKIPAEGRIE